jgi:hypothetical protein
MRKLTEQELELVQTSIIAKEISVLEILAEIYDHYISHLEGFSEEEFKSELAKLESIWTYAYCKKIVKEFNSNTISSIQSMQWKLIKTYFSWPKFLITAFVFLCIYFFVNFSPANYFILGVLIPVLVFLIGFSLVMSYRSNRKYKILKSIFNFSSTGIFISSGETSYLLTHSIFPINLFSCLIIGPKNLGIIDNFSNPWMSLIILLFSFFLFLHTLTIHEAWKIKSKNVLI